MMTSQNMKSVDFTKAQKFRYLENETFFLQIKKFINYTSRTTQPAITCSKLTIETLEQGVKYVQS